MGKEKEEGREEKKKKEEGSYGLASCQLKSTTKEDRMRLGKVKKGEERGGGRSLLCEQGRPE